MKGISKSLLINGSLVRAQQAEPLNSNTYEKSSLLKKSPLLILLLIIPFLSACSEPITVVYPADKFPLSFGALGKITAYFESQGVALPLTLKEIRDEIPVFDDLNAAFGFTSELYGKYQDGGRMIFWNTGSDIGGGGCGANGSVAYVYIGLPHEWTIMGVAKHVMHELGHSIGDLPHSLHPGSVMGPEINDMNYLAYAKEEWILIGMRLMEWE